MEYINTPIRKIIYLFDTTNENETKLVVEHNLGSEPLLNIIDEDGNIIECSVQHSKNNVTISSNVGLKGKVILVG